MVFIWIFNNFNELVSKIKYYLKNEDEREMICRNGYFRCYNEYSYKKIMQNITVFPFLNENGGGVKIIKLVNT